jgi:pimeloyl-ACP methyl ester carboxylesterase
LATAYPGHALCVEEWPGEAKSPARSHDRLRSGAIEEVGKPMATFVLVHPAWFGGWCWRKLTPLLHAQGHTVHTPTLTGLGERAHLANRWVGLETHVSDVANVLRFEDIHDVILVGNSSAGAVITVVADRAPERIQQVVYLDAFVPTDGQSLVDLIPWTGSLQCRRWSSRRVTAGCYRGSRPRHGRSSLPMHGR